MEYLADSRRPTRKGQDDLCVTWRGSKDVTEEERDVRNGHHKEESAMGEPWFVNLMAMTAGAGQGGRGL